MGEEAFNSKITPENFENPYAFWTKIISQYASQSVKNKGRVWLCFMRYELNGNLKEYMTECT